MAPRDLSPKDGPNKQCGFESHQQRQKLLMSPNGRALFFGKSINQVSSLGRRSILAGYEEWFLQHTSNVKTQVLHLAAPKAALRSPNKLPGSIPGPGSRKINRKCQQASSSLVEQRICNPWVAGFEASLAHSGTLSRFSLTFLKNLRKEN